MVSGALYGLARVCNVSDSWRGILEQLGYFGIFVREEAISHGSVGTHAKFASDYIRVTLSFGIVKDFIDSACRKFIIKPDLFHIIFQKEYCCA